MRRTLAILMLAASLGPAAATPAAKPTAAARGVTESEIEAGTLRYFDRLDKGDYAGAFALLGPAAIARPFAEWRADNKARREATGPLREMRVLSLTRYDDPPDAAEPGVYVAADFVGRYGQRGFICGYLMWHAGADGRFSISRQEDGVLTDAQAGRMAPEMLRQMAKQLGCRTE